MILFGLISLGTLCMRAYEPKIFKWSERMSKQGTRCFCLHMQRKKTNMLIWVDFIQCKHIHKIAKGRNLEQSKRDFFGFKSRINWIWIDYTWFFTCAFIFTQKTRMNLFGLIPLGSLGMRAYAPKSKDVKARKTRCFFLHLQRKKTNKLFGLISFSSSIFTKHRNLEQSKEAFWVSNQE